MDILDVLAEDAVIVMYRPSLKEITGSVNSAILLSQMLYYAKITDNNFYKFKMPCKHRLYKEGDSWCEVLGFSKFEFENALKALKDKELVSVKTTIDRLTFYSLDYDKIKALLVNIETRFRKSEKVDLGKSRNSTYINLKTISSKVEKLDLDSYTKNYSKNYSKNLHNIGDEKSSLDNSKKTDTKTKSKKATKDFKEIDLPSYIDKETWNDFVEHRRQIKKPLTELAVKRLFLDFEKWNKKGLDVNSAINQSIANGYQGVFEPKQNFSKESVSEAERERQRQEFEELERLCGAENSLDTYQPYELPYKNQFDFDEVLDIEILSDERKLND